MKQSMIRICLFLILALASYILTDTAVIAIDSDMSSNWSIFTIDDIDAGYYVHHSDTSVAVDNKDGIHISYRGPDSTVTQLLFARSGKNKNTDSYETSYESVRSSTVIKTSPISGNTNRLFPNPHLKKIIPPSPQRLLVTDPIP